MAASDLGVKPKNAPKNSMPKPVRRKRGERFTMEERDLLLCKFEDLYVQGYNLHQISQALGVDYKTAQGYRDVILERWGRKKNRSELEQTREQLVTTAQAVNLRAFQMYGRSTVSFAVRTNALKVVLAAGERIARLYGLDTTPIRIEEGGENAYPMKKLPTEFVQQLDDFLTTCNRNPKGIFDDEDGNGS